MATKRTVSAKSKLLYKCFKAENPSITVSKSTFFKHRPSHVLSFKKMPFKQCLCDICQNVVKNLKVLNLNLPCEHKIPDKYHLCTIINCDTLSLACLECKCSFCGPWIFKDRMSSLLGDKAEKLVLWERWEYVVSEKELVEHFGSLGRLLTEFTNEIHDVKFSKHLFVAKHQQKQFSNLIKNIPSKWAVAVIDFAENYRCVTQDEVQSAYYSYNQVTLFPCVMYYNCPHCPERVVNYFIYVSDDMVHDASFAHIAMGHACSYLQNLEFEHLVLFSDGAPNQFKCQLPFRHLGELTKTISIERCFFGSRHGKNPCDACGGVVKRLVTDAVRSQNYTILSSSSFFQFAFENLSLPPIASESPHNHLKRSFFYILKDEVQKLRDSNFKFQDTTIPGTRNLHSVRYVQDNILAVRNLSCFCSACIDHEFENCSSKSLSGGWELIKRVVSDVKPQQITRTDFFSGLQTRMASCKTFSELLALCSSCQSDIARFELPSQNINSTTLSSKDVDAKAAALLPACCPNGLKPKNIVSDGNCLPRTLSFLVFGSEEHHIEMRCRIVYELCFYKYHYTSDAQMGLDFLSLYRMLSPQMSHSIVSTFEQETLSVARLSEFMGNWQVHACASILHSPVFSIHPDRGQKDVREKITRVLQPRIPYSGPTTLHCIFWTSERDDMTEEYWVPNHFVPLLPFVQCNFDFHFDTLYRVTWEGIDYIAKFTEIDHSTGQVCVSFMHGRDNRYTWPSKPDFSWENVGDVVVLGEVDLELDFSMSTQRTQWFKLK